MSNRRRLTRAVLASVLAAAPLAEAQHTGFYFTSPLSVGGSRESKFIVDDRELSDDVVVVAPPTVSFVRLSPRGEFSLSYQPEFQAFTRHSELNAVNHVAELVFSRATSPHVTLAFGDTFISTADPSRRMVDSVVLLPRDRFTENSAYVELTRRFGNTTTLSFRVDGTLTRIHDPQSSRTGLSDRLGSAANVNLARNLGRRHVLGWTYMFLDSRPLGEAAQPRTLPTGFILPAPAPEQAHSGAMTWVYMGDSTNLRLAGGLVTGRVFTYTGGAQIEKYIGKRSAIALIAQRNLSYFGGVVPVSAGSPLVDAPAAEDAVSAPSASLGSGIAPLGLYESLVARLKFDITRRLTATAAGVMQRSVSDLTALEVRSDFARLRLDWQVSRAVALYGCTGRASTSSWASP
jgi:hypothetical protein